MWTSMHTILAPSKKGEAEIKHITIDPGRAELSMLRQIATRGREVAVSEGTYARLYVEDQLVMSDTNMERESNQDAVIFSHGHVLIAGLGLGMILLPILAKDSVRSVTVVEKSQDVIDLVEGPIRKAIGPRARRLEVEQGDIFDWKAPKGMKYNTMYFDIWPSVSRGNLPEMRRLHRRYATYLVKGGWKESWMRGELVDVYA